MMADVHCGNPVVYDPIGREKMVWDIYDLTDPLDSWTPNAATLVNPGEVKVSVVDPVVVKVDWYLDNRLVAKDGGGAFVSARHISRPGEYTVRAHAYDEGHIEVYFPGAGRYSLETLSLEGTSIGGMVSGYADGEAVRIPWEGTGHPGLRILRVRQGGHTQLFKWAATLP